MRINLASNRLAFTLLLILIILIIFSAIIPQRDFAVGQIVDLEEKLGEGYIFIEKLKLDQIYTTPYFFILLGLLTLNILFGNIKRFRLIYKSEKTLFKIRHMGSIFFHLSLILIMAGIILNYLYKFEGIFPITEGQQLSDAEEIYSYSFKGPLNNYSFNKFELKLDSISTSIDEYDASSNKIYAVYKPTSEDYALPFKVQANLPFKTENISFHYNMKTGYAPVIEISDTTGQQLIAGILRLAMNTTENGINHYDFVVLNDRMIRISFEIIEKKIDKNIKVIIETEEEKLYQGNISLSDTIFVDNLTIIIKELRRWSYLKVMTSPFLNLIFFGFWFGLASMVLGFIPRVINKREKQ